MVERPVAIVGGGMVGLTAACVLARLRFDIELIDAMPSPSWIASTFGARVSTINVASQRLLESVDVWEAIRGRRANPVRAMEIWDSISDAHIRFDARDLGEEALAHIVENDLVCTTLAERLNQNYSVKLHYDTSLRSLRSEQRHIHLGVGQSDQTLDASMVIAADGGRSMVRQLAGIEVDEQDFEQDAIVATVESTRSHHDTAFQCFTPYGPVALLPLSGGKCSMVWSTDRVSEDGPSVDNIESIDAGLNRIFGRHLGQLAVTGDVVRFPLWHRHARTYATNRLALVGDAAHTTHPLAGLGANLGLLDVAALAECMERAIETGKSPTGLSTLRRYARWRQGENALVLGTMRAFKTGFGRTGSDLTDSLLARARTAGFSMADQTPLLKRAFATYAMGTTGDIPALCRNSAQV